MARIGYARVSTADQDLEQQLAKLKGEAASWSARKKSRVRVAMAATNSAPCSNSSDPAMSWW